MFLSRLRKECKMSKLILLTMEQRKPGEESCVRVLAFPKRLCYIKKEQVLYQNLEHVAQKC